MKIQKVPPTGEELGRFYIQAGWVSEPDPAKMERTVKSPSDWYTVRDDRANLLGIGRIITDFERYAFIVDMIVDEHHQHKGIGTAIMKEIISNCENYGIDTIDLWPSKGKVPFYENFGFVALPSDQPHMKYQPKQ